MYFLSRAYNRLPINDLNWMPGNQLCLPADRYQIRATLENSSHLDNFGKKKKIK